MTLIDQIFIVFLAINAARAFSYDIDRYRAYRAKKRLLKNMYSPQFLAAADRAMFRINRPCTIPPPGWRCTRMALHDGPCAAVPDDWRSIFRKGRTKL